MHYIIGTYFVTPQRLGLSENEKKLAPGTQYNLIHIQKSKNKAIYSLLDTKRTKIELTFDSCRDADKFIARMRKENIPDYDAIYSQVSETA